MRERGSEGGREWVSERGEWVSEGLAMQLLEQEMEA